MRGVKLRVWAALAALALAVSVPPAPAGAQTAQLTIAGSSGSQIVVSVSPSSLTWAADVVSPGSGWIFGSPASGYPVAWYYAQGGSLACIAVTVTASLSGHMLTAAAAMSPSVPVSVRLGLPTGQTSGAGFSSCPSSPPSVNTLGFQTLTSTAYTVGGSLPAGTTVAYFYLVLYPTGTVTTSTTITLTFGVQ
jgi:hypothetical protein